MYTSLQDVLIAANSASEGLRQLNDEGTRLMLENKRVKTENKILGAYSQTARALIEQGHDLASLQQISRMATKYGGPIQVYEALNKYGSIDVMSKRGEELRALNANLGVDIRQKEVNLANLRNFIDRANQRVGEIDANYKTSITAQIIYDILASPVKLDVEPDTFKRTTLHFLTGLKQYVTKKEQQNGGWGNVSLHLSNLIKSLTEII